MVYMGEFALYMKMFQDLCKMQSCSSLCAAEVAHVWEFWGWKLACFIPEAQVMERHPGVPVLPWEGEEHQHGQAFVNHPREELPKVSSPLWQVKSLHALVCWGGSRDCLPRAAANHDLLTK